MKRTLAIILTAVFLSALSIPCGATGTETTASRVYPGFADVAEGSASYEAIKLCYERGLMNGASDTAFNPQGKLTVAQLVVLAARLYDLQCGGDGTVPDLPDMSQPYLRFYDKEGNLIASYTRPEELPAFNSVANPYIALSETPGDSDLPETCTLQIGYEGYNWVGHYEGTKESHESAGGAMHQGFVGTGYRFTDPKAGRFTTLPRADLVEQYKNAWWFPAVFYLGSEGVMGFEGDLVLRASNWIDDRSAYDPLTRFSKDHASRALFAWLVDLAAGKLETVNESAAAPDVEVGETRDAEAILRLYQAGVLTGINQAGNFGGDKELTRAQAAIMLARVLEPSLRVRAG